LFVPPSDGDAWFQELRTIPSGRISLQGSWENKYSEIDDLTHLRPLSTAAGSNIKFVFDRTRLRNMWDIESGIVSLDVRHPLYAICSSFCY